ncbi:hypothetical protein L1D14_10820 [Vibrio tubiashii]|uniref:hypothetical protein n=1 Tax=Vibrio tubiashii TaxID=29498 RepID=UPI001EFC5058|nr:hypothetical protein [Vibrio tubiashii]MCG9576731.1 hypothetical protein [Vibrio tubiashii]
MTVVRTSCTCPACGKQTIIHPTNFAAKTAACVSCGWITLEHDQSQNLTELMAAEMWLYIFDTVKQSSIAAIMASSFTSLPSSNMQFSVRGGHVVPDPFETLKQAA